MGFSSSFLLEENHPDMVKALSVECVRCCVVSSPCVGDTKPSRADCGCQRERGGDGEISASVCVCMCELAVGKVRRDTQGAILKRDGKEIHIGKEKEKH